MASGSVMVSLGMTNTVSRSSVRSSRLETVMRAGASWCCASAYTTVAPRRRPTILPATIEDRKSTRLNSSHVAISYAVFCLKKKKNEDATYASHSERCPHADHVLRDTRT